MVVGWSIINKDNVQVQVQPLTGSEGSLSSLLHLGLRGSGALLEHVGESALAAVLAIVVPAHENARAALGRGALAPQALDLRHLPPKDPQLSLAHTEPPITSSLCRRPL